jgi:hypothetical protein
MTDHHQNFTSDSSSKLLNGVQALQHRMGCMGMKGKIFAAKLKEGPKGSPE